MKVLVAVDDSKFSKAALEAVIAQFRAGDTEVRVIHIVEPVALSAPPQMAPGYAPELRDQVKEAEELVERSAKTLRAAGFKVDAKAGQGDIREKIIDAAAEWHADIIVIGSHGRSAIRRFLLGSVPEFVARHAHCSVLIVRIPSNR
jgi:nucleotide-binding universal stress UspA family protein